MMPSSSTTSFTFFAGGERRFQTNRLVPARAGAMESLGAYVALSSAATGFLLVSGLLENVRITAPVLSRNASVTSPWGAGAGAGAGGGLSLREDVTATPGKRFS